MSRPSALAARRLITRSNLVGCSISARLGAVENSIHISRGSPIEISVARTVTHEASRFGKLLEKIHRRQPAPAGKVHDPLSLAEKNGVRENDQRTNGRCAHGGKCLLQRIVR